MVGLTFYSIREPDQHIEPAREHQVRCDARQIDAVGDQRKQNHGRRTECRLEPTALDALDHQGVHTGGGWISANKGLDEANLVNPIDKLSVEILKDKNTVFRFDGSDQMPAAVGSNAFWKQATSWVTGQDTKTTVNNIENAWPK